MTSPKTIKDPVWGYKTLDLRRCQSHWCFVSPYRLAIWDGPVMRRNERHPVYAATEAELAWEYGGGDCLLRVRCYGEVQIDSRGVIGAETLVLDRLEALRDVPITQEDLREMAQRYGIDVAESVLPSCPPPDIARWQEFVACRHKRSAARLRARLRRLVGGARTGCPRYFRVVEGAGLDIRGEAGGWYTRGGSPIYHPTAYAQVGWSNMVYRRDTRVVYVGVERLEELATREPWLARALRRARGGGANRPSSGPQMDSPGAAVS